MVVQTQAEIGDQTQSAGYARSKYGARIGYRQVGHGPGIMVLHGAMESAESHRELAEALADSFTVTLVDRRGRGMSDPYGNHFSVQEDVEDVQAVHEATGAHFLFGVSSGAVITLQAALFMPGIQKIAIYEPPLSLARAEAQAILTRYNREMAAGKLTAALVTAMLGAQMGPPVFQKLPRWLLEFLTVQGMKAEERSSKPGDATMRALAPTLHYDFSLIVEMSERMESFHALQKEVLLLGGSQSPAYLQTANAELEKILLHARRVVIPGVGHGGSGNKNRGGKPEKVAEELRKFFIGSSNPK